MNLASERDFALQVVIRLREAGHEALWAGGCVRDLLLGGVPSDYDVATSATPQQVRELFGLRRTLPVGLSFGVVIVLPPTAAAGQIEVATFRTETTYSDGRRPDSVEYSTAEHDAFRRDFTINGMFYDPLEESTIDYVGGRQDLEARIIRAIGNADDRIGEDKLRMLRAVRFAARFDFAIAESTLAAVAAHAHELAVVSGERIAVEVAKTLATDRAAWAVQHWQQTGLLAVFLPELARRWAAVERELLSLLEAASGMRWQSKMAAVLWPLVRAKKASTSELVDQLKQRLKWSNEGAREIAFALKQQSTLERADAMAWSGVQPLLIDDRIAAAVDLLRLRNRCGQVSLQTLAWVEERLTWPPPQLNPAPLLSGSDLIRSGYRPSPQFSQLLQQVRARQLDGQLLSASAALEWVAETMRGANR